MRNFIKICLIFILILFITSFNILAVNMEENIYNENDSIYNSTEIIKNIDDFENLPSTNPTLSTYVDQDDDPVYKMSTTTTSTDSDLEVSDIIDIILISVGIVIILLAIAILIRLKH